MLVKYFILLFSFSFVRHTWQVCHFVSAECSAVRVPVLLLWLKDTAYLASMSSHFPKIFRFCHVCTKHKLEIMQLAHGVIDKIYYIANFI